MLAGALIAGATDLTYSLPGYIWVTICAISTAMYLLLIRALKDSTGVVLHCMLFPCREILWMLDTHQFRKVLLLPVAVWDSFMVYVQA